jgi:hypothetical protein
MRFLMPTSDPDLSGEWVLFGTSDKEEFPVDTVLLTAVREAWPHALAHARRRIDYSKSQSEKTAVAAEVWEKVVRSVAKTRRREAARGPRITDLQSYLIGAFHYRLNRYLEREQRQLETIQFVPSLEELERLEKSSWQWIDDLERSITITQIMAHMDPSTREIWKLRQMRWGWKEIANDIGLNEQQAKMKFQRGLQKTKERILAKLREKLAPPKPDEDSSI